MRRLMIGRALVLIMILVTGCSGTAGIQPDMQVPSESINEGQIGEGAESVLLGLWTMTYDPATGKLDVVRAREGEQLLNALGFLEPPPLVDLTIDFETLLFTPETNKLEVVVYIRHPFTDPNNTFMGFDTRGIVFGPEIVNGDGYTPVLGPDSFSNICFGYINGLLGTPQEYAHFTGSIWPYKYFAKGITPYEPMQEYFDDPFNLDMRGQFPQGMTIGRHYVLDFGPDPNDFLIFNYAVLTSFDWPVGSPPFGLENFPVETANTPEPFNMKITNVNSTLYYNSNKSTGGGTVSFDAEIYDWQDAEGLNVSVKSLDELTVPERMATSSEPGSTSKSWIYHFTDVPGTPENLQDIELLLKAEDPGTTYGEIWMCDALPPQHPLYGVNVYSVFDFSVEVIENPGPVWNPVLSLAAGYDVLCRSGSIYPDENSSFDSLSRFNYTGGEPYDPDGGQVFKKYYISNSPDVQEGSSIGWTTFTSVGYLETDWDLHGEMAPARLYVWVVAEDEYGERSDPVRWISDGGEIELCSMITGWDDNFPSDWYGGGNTIIGTWLGLAVSGYYNQDSYIYTNKSWTLGSDESSADIEIEFSRSPLGWVINSNELSLRVSSDGGAIPIHTVGAWAGSYPMGGPVIVTLPQSIQGEPLAGSERRFGWYLTDLSSLGSALAYIDYMGVYAHPE